MLQDQPRQESFPFGENHMRWNPAAVRAGMSEIDLRPTRTLAALLFLDIKRQGSIVLEKMNRLLCVYGG